MKRREFIAATAAVAAVTASGSIAQTPANNSRQMYYLLRNYTTAPGAGNAFDSYIRDALIPAANRLGITPVGVFSPWFGPVAGQGTRLVLLPGRSLETLATLDLRLMDDAEYMKSAGGFLDARGGDIAVTKLESQLMRSMDGLDGNITIPANLTKPAARIFELRVYAQPTWMAHRRKVKMFEEGEAISLAEAGFNNVFYATNLVGGGMPGGTLPSLTYMWVYPSLAQREQAEKLWMSKEFTDSNAQKKVMQRPDLQPSGGAISNIILRPAAYSQM